MTTRMDTNIHLRFIGADTRLSYNGLAETLGLEKRLEPSRAFASILKSYTAYVIHKVCTVLELFREGREAAEGHRASLVVDVHRVETANDRRQDVGVRDHAHQLAIFLDHWETPELEALETRQDCLKGVMSTERDNIACHHRVNRVGQTPVGKRLDDLRNRNKPHQPKVGIDDGHSG